MASKRALSEAGDPEDRKSPKQPRGNLTQHPQADNTQQPQVKLTQLPRGSRARKERLAKILEDIDKISLIGEPHVPDIDDETCITGQIYKALKAGPGLAASSLADLPPDDADDAADDSQEELDEPIDDGSDVVESDGEGGEVARDEDEEMYEESEDEKDSYRDVVVVGDNWYTIPRYFGPQWVELIDALYAVAAMEAPSNMPTRPHEYQLKAAAQVTYLCKSVFRGALLGHPMGLGKTYIIVLHLYAIRHEPGMSLVVCPASLCQMWKDTLEGAFEEGHGFKTYIYRDPSVTAHWLLAQKFDVVICSFQQLEANRRAKLRWPELIKQNNQLLKEGKRWVGPKPKRPTCALVTDFWTAAHMPYKRVIVDEAHGINKWDSVRHQAIASLPTEAFILLSGTLPNNRWYDMGGYLDFIRQPITTPQAFDSLFTKTTYDNTNRRAPGTAEMGLLQRLFMAFTIIHPADCIQLPPCHKMAFHIRLRPDRARYVADLTNRFRRLAAMNAKKIANGKKGDDVLAALGCAVKAQNFQLHPGLVPPDAEAPFSLDHEDMRNISIEEIEETVAEENVEAECAKRSQWLRTLEGWSEEQLMDSEHVMETVNLLVKLCLEDGRKIVVFSQYLRYLDILDKALEYRDLKPLRYDGTVAPIKRKAVQTEFETPNNRRPMLMTIGAGGVGLNLTAADTVFFCEEGWNENVIAQAIARVHRQGQTEPVLVIKYITINSKIDEEIMRTRLQKIKVNRELLAPLIVRHDEKPQIPELLFYEPLVIPKDEDQP